jgi:hypothetical protein
MFNKYIYQSQFVLHMRKECKTLMKILLIILAIVLTLLLVSALLALCRAGKEADIAMGRETRVERKTRKTRAK